MTVALEGGEWSAARPGCILPPGKIQYPFLHSIYVVNYDLNSTAGLI